MKSTILMALILLACVVQCLCFFHRSRSLGAPGSPAFALHRHQTGSKLSLNASYRSIIVPSMQPQRLLSATSLLLAVNAAVYVMTSADPDLVDTYVKSNQRIGRYGEYYRLLSSVLTHGSYRHLAANSFSLYQLGPQAEQVFGSWTVLYLYLASGILTNLVTYSLGTSARTIGASGATLGLMGALASYFLYNQKALGQRADIALSSIVTNVAVSAFNGIYGNALNEHLGSRRPNTDNNSHMIGMLIGLVLGYCVGPTAPAARTAPAYFDSGW